MSIEQIRAREQAATEGPWSWRGNTDSHQLRLASWRKGCGQITVMDFERWGMQSASPRFLGDDLFMVTAKGIAEYEVARNQNLPATTPRTHPKVYRADVVGINHPDAVFIAHARQDVPALLAAVDAVLALHYRESVEEFYNDIDGGSRSRIVSYRCGHCESYEQDDVSYPCPTVKAINTALEA